MNAADVTPPARPGTLTIYFSAGERTHALAMMRTATDDRAPIPAAEKSHHDCRDHLLAAGLDTLLQAPPGTLRLTHLTGFLEDGTARWEAVASLRAAGWSLHAVLDVTDIAELAEPVGAITGRHFPQRVPDDVMRLADRVVWVDSRPQQASAAHSALRSLALRCLAAVDLAAGARPVEPRQHLLAVIGTEGGDQVVDRAWKLAQQLGASWEVVHPHPPGARFSSRAAKASVQRALAMAGELGAHTGTIPSLNIAESVAQIVRAHRICHVVAGIHADEHRERWPQRLAELAPAVHLSLLPIQPDPRRWSQWRSWLSRGVIRRAAWFGPVAAIAGCALVTVLGTLAHGRLEAVNIALLYLLLVFVLGRNIGRFAAAVASLLGSWLFYVYFVPPYRAFGINEPQYLITFAAMLTVALITGDLTASLRRQNAEVLTREARTRALYELARALAGAVTSDEVAAITERIFRDRLGANCCFVWPGTATAAGSKPSRVAFDETLAQRLLDASVARQPLPEYPEGPVTYHPLRAPSGTHGLLVVMSHPEADEISGRQSDLDICASLVAIALDRIHYEQVSQQALLRIESERLRNSLLTAISHDLRTPLAALVGLAESLRFVRERQQLDRRIDELTDEAGRLSRMVDSLLEMARLQTGDVRLRSSWQSIEEIIGCALYGLRSTLGRHRVETRVPSELPLIQCDPTLVERVIANLLENAAKYTPAGGAITIEAYVKGGELAVTVADNGPGVTASDDIFAKFSRGQVESAIPGVGLGLAICKSIVSAHGGTLWHERPTTGGAAFRFTLPLGKSPSLVDASEA